MSPVKSRWFHVCMCGWMLFGSATMAASPFREMVSFSVATNTGFGRDVFIAGNHPDVGNWNPTLGTKLVWNPGNIWTGSVALEAGTALQYKPVLVPISVTGLCDGVNWQYLPPGDGNHLNVATQPQPPAPYAGKFFYYHSGLTNVTIIYSINGGAFTSAPLAQIGPGRASGEFLHAGAAIGTPGAAIEFVMSGMSGTNTFYDHAPSPGYGTPPDNNYFTTLDMVFLQDGDLFNYQPPASVSVPSIIVSNAVSTFTPSPSRTMKIYLPRGYVQNTWKRYPVLYMHDGENVMPPYTGLGQWQADQITTREVSQGRMREVIIVSLNSTANRTREYLPPEDNEGGQGFGDVYAKFLVHDVKAKIDAQFRTLPDRPNTLTAGSSSGGLITTYLGWSTNVFGKIGSFSPAYLISPNFNNTIAADPKRPLRIYTDMGTVGYPETALVADYWVVFDHLLRDGYVQQSDLLSWLACGAEHNETAWAARLPVCLRFLLNIWDERNHLAHTAAPPVVDSFSVTGTVTSVSHASLAGWPYRLEGAPRLTGPWTGLVFHAASPTPWQTRSFEMSGNPTADVHFLRVVAEGITP